MTNFNVYRIECIPGPELEVNNIYLCSVYLYFMRNAKTTVVDLLDPTKQFTRTLPPSYICNIKHYRLDVRSSV